MALSDPAQILLISILTILIPLLVIYWVVRLAMRHELKKRDRITTRS